MGSGRSTEHDEKRFWSHEVCENGRCRGIAACVGDINAIVGAAVSETISLDLRLRNKILKGVV